MSGLQKPIDMGCLQHSLRVGGHRALTDFH